MEIKAFFCSFKKSFSAYKLLRAVSTHGLVILFFLLVLPVPLFCGNYPHVAAEPSGSKPHSPHSSPQTRGQALWAGRARGVLKITRAGRCLRYSPTCASNPTPAREISPKALTEHDVGASTAASGDCF